MLCCASVIPCNHHYAYKLYFIHRAFMFLLWKPLKWFLSQLWSKWSCLPPVRTLSSGPSVGGVVYHQRAVFNYFQERKIVTQSLGSSFPRKHDLRPPLTDHLRWLDAGKQGGQALRRSSDWSSWWEWFSFRVWVMVYDLCGRNDSFTKKFV